MKTEFRFITKRCRHLLQLEEGYDVEFKKTIESITTDDIVAFANSDLGGVILAGIDEKREKSGRIVGDIVGCHIGDSKKMIILNKADSCVPSVPIMIFTENTQKKPFIRIEIPSGKDKPYCTPKGTYKIRGDGKNRPLLPNLMLSLLLDKKSKEFKDRFSSVTIDLENKISEVQSTIISQTVSMFSDFENLAERITQELSELFDKASETVDAVSEACDYGDQSVASLEQCEFKIDEILGETKEIDLLLSDLFKQLKFVTPHERAQKEWAIMALKKLTRVIIDQNGYKDLSNIKKELFKNRISRESWHMLTDQEVNKIINSEIDKAIAKL